MDKRMKNGIVMAVMLPILGYLCYDIYKQVFPSRPAGGDVPAVMESLPTLPQNAQAPAKPQTPATPPKPQNNQNNQSSQNQPAAKPTPQTPAKPVPANNQNNANSPDKPVVLASNSQFGENPFVEMNNLSEEHRMEQSMLPAIPNNTPIPNVSNVPVPPPPSGIAIPTPPEGVGASAPTVTGFIESSNGAKIALMSDGSVVNEGDDFNGSKIAYIGGGSVQFDDGKTLDLVNSIEVKRNQ